MTVNITFRCELRWVCMGTNIGWVWEWQVLWGWEFVVEMGAG